MRDIQDAEQVVDAILELARRGATGTVNIGTGVGVSVADIARAIARSLGRTIAVEGTSAPRPERSWPARPSARSCS